MNKHLQYKGDKSDKFWKIEVNGKTHTVTYGKTDRKGISKTKEFDSEEKALKAAEQLIQSKLKKGYKEINIQATEEQDFQIFHNETDWPGWYIVDLENPKQLKAIIVDYINHSKAIGPNSHLKDAFDFGPPLIDQSKADGNNFKAFVVSDHLEEYPYLKGLTMYESTIDESFYSEFHFFMQVIKRYLQLIPLIIEIMEYALSVKREIHSEEVPHFTFPILALAMNDQKYIKDYLRFLYINDIDHGMHQGSHMYRLIHKWGLNSNTYPLFAAACCNPIGLAFDCIGIPLELMEKLDVEDIDQMDTFFQYCLLHLLLDQNGKKVNLQDYSSKQMHQWANEVFDHSIEGIFESLELDYDYERILFAIKNINPKKPHKLSDLLNENYEISIYQRSLSAAGYFHLAYEYGENNDQRKAIENYDKAIQINPRNVAYYINRGYCYDLLDKKAEAVEDWLKGYKIDKYNYQLNKNLAFSYYRYFPDFRKAIKHQNVIIKRSKKEEDYLDRGLMYQHFGDLEKAGKDYKKALKSNKEEILLLYVNGQITLLNYEEAFDYLKNKKFESEKNQIIQLYLTSILLIVLNQSSKKELKETKDRRIKITKKLNWDFQDIKLWLTYADLEEKQETAIIHLIGIMEGVNT